MKKISLTLVALMLISPLFALEETRGKGMQDAKSKMQSAMQQIQSKEPAAEAHGYGDTTYRTLSKLDANLDSNYFKKTLETDYTKAKIMEMLGQLAVTSAFSIGTAALGQQTGIVSSTAAGLTGSGDPQYQELGAQFETLASQMKAGNDIEAKSTAESIQQYISKNSPAIDAGYTPTAQENNLLSGLASVLSGSMGRIMGMLGTFGLSALFKMLGFGVLASNPIGMAIAIIMQETLGAVATGITGGQVNWTPIEQTAVNQAVGVADQGAAHVETKISTAITQDVDTSKIVNENKTGGTDSLPGK